MRCEGKAERLRVNLPVPSQGARPPDKSASEKEFCREHGSTNACWKLRVGQLVKDDLNQCPGSLTGLDVVFLELGAFPPCTGFVLS